VLLTGRTTNRGGEAKSRLASQPSFREIV
jgi:hypothetical protein